MEAALPEDGQRLHRVQHAAGAAAARGLADPAHTAAAQAQRGPPAPQEGRPR